MPHPLEPVFPFIEKIKKAGYKAYVVGGAVREYLLGNLPKEFDISTNIPADKLLELFPDAKPVFPYKYGVFELKAGEDLKIEFARMRVDINYAGRHSDVIFTDSIETDLKRREITINGIAYDVDTGSIIDPFCGVEDIKKGLIRTIGDPNSRFREDKVRIFRAIRFAARLGFKLECETEDAIKRIGPHIVELSKDTIREELEKLFMLDSFARALYFLWRLGLVKVIFDIEPSSSVMRELLLAARFISKRCKCVDVRWAVLFYFLDPPECIIKELIKERRKLKLIDYIRENIEYLDDILFGKEEPDRVLAVLDNKDLPNLVVASDAASYGRSKRAKNYKLIIYSKFPGVFSPRLISGRDLTLEFGVSGKIIGDILTKIRFCQLRGEIKTRKEALDKAKEFIKHYEKGSN